ncbi:hybrid sensor histidine kinase/response regulator, partial [Escherichia coli]
EGKPAIDPQRLNEMDRLIVAAIHTATPRSIVLQLDDIRRFLPRNDSDSALAFILPDFNAELARLAPLSAQLEESDLAIGWYMFHIKALVALLNGDINQYVARVAQASEARAAQSHQQLRS